jgi:hypothetical protein
MDRTIIYTAKIDRTFKNITHYQITRYDNDSNACLNITNYLLENITDNGLAIKYSNDYSTWIQEAFKTIELYFTTNNFYYANQVPTQTELSSYKQFKKLKLDQIYSNLLLTDGVEQKRYIIQYCNHDNINIKMIACDILHNKDIIKFTNKRMLEYIIQGKIDQLEELTQ